MLPQDTGEPTTLGQREPVGGVNGVQASAVDDARSQGTPAPEPVSIPDGQERPLDGKRELRAALRGDVRAFAALVRKLSWWLSARYALRSATSTGRWVKTEGRPVVRNGGIFTIGERAYFVSTIVRSEFVIYRGGRLEIGARTFVNYGCSIAVQKHISIGSDCLIGPYVNILDNQYHSLLDRTASPPSQQVIIGNNVWIGTRAIILPGVTIGDHAVIGAGAVVTRDVPARSVAAGNPARVLRTF
jgi:maltose O-acetyltransferase